MFISGSINHTYKDTAFLRLSIIQQSVVRGVLRYRVVIRCIIYSFLKDYAGKIYAVWFSVQNVYFTSIL